MTRIPDLLQQGRCYSFEFFPPRTPEAEETLEATLVDLEPLQPSYVSVTYGAGGSTRERTHDLVVRINERHALCAMAHLTCVGHTRAELTDIVTRYGHAGIDNILALGGDPPAGVELPPGELEHAVDLVRLIRGVGDFAVGVAAHPEDEHFPAGLQRVFRADSGVTDTQLRKLLSENASALYGV